MGVYLDDGQKRTNKMLVRVWNNEKYICGENIIWYNKVLYYLAKLKVCISYEPLVLRWGIYPQEMPAHWSKIHVPVHSKKFS